MTRRGLTFLLACAPAFAQLPRSQAPVPREEASPRLKTRAESDYSLAPPARLDAVVTDLRGGAVAGLTGADFTLEADGKPQKIERCEFRSDEPLRLAVIVDDLSLSIENLNRARRALREFIASGRRANDEMAILRAGAGSGALDRFTSDPALLHAAIDRARPNPEAEAASAETFAAGALGVVRTVLRGMRDLPGRKALLVIGERLADAAPLPDSSLTVAANRASAVVYALDMAPPQGATLLDQGFTLTVRESGGVLIEGGDAARALSRIAQDRSYYLLTYAVEGAPFDYIARTPRIDRVVLRTGRPETVVRARIGVFGLGDDAEGLAYEEAERSASRSLDSDLVTGGIRARLTAMLSMGTAWQVESIVHLEPGSVTFVKGLDGLYRTRVETATALVDARGEPIKEAARAFQAQLPESSYRRFQEHGFDYSAVLPIPREGSYQVRSVVRDDATGRIGSSRQFVRAAGWAGGKLAMSAVVVRGEMTRDAEGFDVVVEPSESASVRIFKAGRKLTYAYNVFNVAADAEKRSTLQTRSEIWREGVRVSAADPKTIEFPASETPGTRTVSGVIALGSMVPGMYLLRIHVVDQPTGRTASQWMDFEVRL